jgi:hypothetical protein
MAARPAESLVGLLLARGTAFAALFLGAAGGYEAARSGVADRRGHLATELLVLVLVASLDHNFKNVIFLRLVATDSMN